MAAAAAAAAGGAALRGPLPDPSDDGPRLRSPSGKGKPVALADITNTGRRNTTRSLSAADVVKENAKLVHLLNEKTRTIELSRVEIQKLHFTLQASRQQNQQLAHANSQMLAELNLGKDRLKKLQHELSCTAALLKLKDSELEKKNKAANQRRKEVNSQDIMKVIPSKVAAAAVPSTTGCQEPPNSITTKRSRNKRKSRSSECTKDTDIMQDYYRPHLQPVISSNHENPRKPVRRSNRLNPGSCDVTEVSCSNLQEDDVVPSAPSSFSVQKQHGRTTGKDVRKPLQNEHSGEVVMASAFKEIQVACSSVPGIEAHQIDDMANNNNQSHLAETQSASLPFNIVEPPKALEDTGNERAANEQKLKNGEDSAIEHINAKCGSSTSKPLRHNEKRKSQRRKCAQLDSVLPENAMRTSETLHEDAISSLPHSSSHASMEQTSQKHTDGCSSMEATEGQVAGRSLRRAAEKVVSYKEMPLNVKMRRP